jgi:hypothetical protein
MEWGLVKSSVEVKVMDVAGSSLQPGDVDRRPASLHGVGEGEAGLRDLDTTGLQGRHHC